MSSSDLGLASLHGLLYLPPIRIPFNLCVKILNGGIEPVLMGFNEVHEWKQPFLHYHLVSLSIPPKPAIFFYMFKSVFH